MGPILPLPALKPGDLVAFQIGTHDGYSPINQHRWGAFKVLHLHSLGKFNVVTVSVLQGLHDACPHPWHLRFRRVLIEHRFKSKTKALHTGKPLIFSGDLTGLSALPSARIVGHEYLLRPAERRALPAARTQGVGSVMGHMSRIALALDHEDRALNDTAAWTAEIERAEAEWRAKMAAARHRQETRLKGLTLAQLLQETPFATWDNRPDLVPPEMTRQVRSAAHALLQTLSALGPKIPRPLARKHLTTFMTRLNELDADNGGWIETDEREDLMAYLEEVCHTIRQNPLLDELDGQRTW